MSEKCSEKCKYHEKSCRLSRIMEMYGVSGSDELQNIFENKYKCEEFKKKIFAKNLMIKIKKVTKY